MIDLKRELVHKILGRAIAYEWTLQGFGMLRLYLRDVGRLHIWSPAYQTPGVSMIHTHAWPLESEIISGTLRNQRYREDFDQDGHRLPPTHMRHLLRTGEGGGLAGPALAAALDPLPIEVYRVGDRYSQLPHEIHETITTDGTVTLVTRPEGEGEKYAYTYSKIGKEWVSAEPRPATIEEIRNFATRALVKWQW